MTAETLAAGILTDITEQQASGRTEVEILVYLTNVLKPLINSLKVLRREHHHCDDSWYCCPKCSAADHMLPAGETVGPRDGQPDVCNCGADLYNAVIDTALERQL